MKNSRSRIITSSALFVMASFLSAQWLCAATLNPQDEASKIVRQDSGTKAQINAAKQKIAQEREAILAAGRKMSQVKKAGDKAAIEQTKKIIDAEVKERKNAISVLKTEIERLQGSAESLAPGRRSRSDEGK